jgi:hypothetical protein
MVLSIDELQKIYHEKKKKELLRYKTIFKLTESHIMTEAVKGHFSCIYVIPSFIVGHALIDIPTTMEYIIGLLNHKGFVAIKINENTIYISWEVVCKKKK